LGRFFGTTDLAVPLRVLAVSEATTPCFNSAAALLICCSSNGIYAPAAVIAIFLSFWYNWTSQLRSVASVPPTGSISISQQDQVDCFSSGALISR